MLFLCFSTAINVQAIAPANVACTITMDGSISSSEWACADQKATFYLDLDNTPDGNGHVNVDGNNYLYLAEDMDNVYIGIDLCGDRSTDENNEWVGAWLVTAGRTFTDWVGWESYIDNGTESLLYSTKDQAPIPFVSNALTTSAVYVNSESEFQVITGTPQGNVTNLAFPGSQPPFNVTAVAAAGFEYRVDFTVNMERCLSLFTSEWFTHVKELQVNLLSQVSAAIATNNLIVWYANGTFSEADPDQVIGINTGTGLTSFTAHIGLGNLSATRDLKVSLKGSNPSAFKEIIDTISFAVQVNDTNYLRTGSRVYYPYSSIKNYQLVKGFGTSPDCGTNHRMFEIRIPKNQIEHYSSTGNLGIMVGGYGTAAITGTNYWVFSTLLTDMQVYNSIRYYYYNMNGVEPPSAVPGYDVAVIACIAGGVITALALKARKGKHGS